MLEQFIRLQISIEDTTQSISENSKLIIDRVSLCTKTDCDFETLRSRLKKTSVHTRLSPSLLESIRALV